MEEWLKSKGFEEYYGMWYWEGNLTSLVVLIEEDGSWSCDFGKGKGRNFHSTVKRKEDAVLFDSLPEDQAKESIERLIAL